MPTRSRAATYARRRRAACRSCNASKCNTEVTTWMRRKKLDERAFLVRHDAVGRAVAEALGLVTAAQTLKRNDDAGFGCCL